MSLSFDNLNIIQNKIKSDLNTKTILNHKLSNDITLILPVFNVISERAIHSRRNKICYDKSSDN